MLASGLLVLSILLRINGQSPATIDTPTQLVVCQPSLLRFVGDNAPFIIDGKDSQPGTKLIYTITNYGNSIEMYLIASPSWRTTIGSASQDIPRAGFVRKSYLGRRHCSWNGGNIGRQRRVGRHQLLEPSHDFSRNFRCLVHLSSLSSRFI
jgi:hypothetical protein